MRYIVEYDMYSESVREYAYCGSRNKAAKSRYIFGSYSTKTVQGYF